MSFVRKFCHVLLLCSLGVDSIAAAWLFINRDYGFEYDDIKLVFNATPLTPEPAFEILEYVAGKLGVDYVILRGSGDYRPPYCRFAWKVNPLKQYVRNLNKPVLLVTGQRKDENRKRGKFKQFDVWFMRDTYVFKPCFHFRKSVTKELAYILFPDLVPIWETIAKINGGHTSLDCFPCLRQQLMQTMKKPSSL